MNRFLKAVLAIATVLSLCGCNQVKPVDTDALSVVATIFPAYDFAKNIAGQSGKVEMLLPPGVESHSYEPSPSDIIKIQNCDVFIYTGGESDSWVEEVLKSLKKPVKTVKMLDCVDLLQEELVEGMQEHSLEHDIGHEDSSSHEHDNSNEDSSSHEHHNSHENTSSHEHDNSHEDTSSHEHDNSHADTSSHEHDNSHEDSHDKEQGTHGYEYDEHVWTSPKNAIKICDSIALALSEAYPQNKSEYTENCKKYTAQLADIDAEFVKIAEQAKNKTLIFGDRFPMRYFADSYGFKYYAAFPGCAAQAEPSAATVAFLIDKTKQENISTVFYIELSNHLIADVISQETKTKTAMLHSCHNVTKAELMQGVSYLSLMKNNIKVLQEALL